MVVVADELFVGFYSLFSIFCILYVFPLFAPASLARCFSFFFDLFRGRSGDRITYVLDRLVSVI